MEQMDPQQKSDPYLWLADDDPRRYQSDEEIMYEKINLSNSALSRKEKARLMKMLIKYRDAFSLRDEIGELFQFLKVINLLWIIKWKDWCL